MKRAPTSRSRPFARLIRCAIVGLGHHEGTRDLRRPEPCDGPQGEGHLSGGRQGGVAAQEQEDHRVVELVATGDVGGRGLSLVRRRSRGDRLLALGPGPVGAPVVEDAPGRHPDEPGLRVVRPAVPRPLVGGGEQSLLQCVLGGVDVAVAAHERSQDVRRARAPHVLDADVGHRSSAPAHIAGLSSTTPPGWANRAVISSARSRLSQSMTKKPASCSFVSAYGPSVARWPCPLQV